MKSLHNRSELPTRSAALGRAGVVAEPLHKSMKVEPLAVAAVALIVAAAAAVAFGGPYRAEGASHTEVEVLA